jgi:uncharacterized protein
VIDRIAPTLRPNQLVRGYQKWRSLLFLHWAMPVEAVQRLLPAGLTVDTFEGRAYVGVLPFTMRGVRPRFAPPLAPLSNFHELNVRTYVHHQGGDPGIWFFSLEAANSLAVRLARRFWHLPYQRARMSMHIDDTEVSYSSERLWPGPLPATFRARWRQGEALGNAVPGTFEHFLVERYILYAEGNGLHQGRVHHRPYPLHAAELLELEQDLLAPSRLPPAEGAPHVLFSPGVDVEIFGLKRV